MQRGATHLRKRDDLFDQLRPWRCCLVGRTGAKEGIDSHPVALHPERILIDRDNLQPETKTQTVRLCGCRTHNDSPDNAPTGFC